ncbi:MAG: phosphoribosylglycinamide formyltransferase [Cyclobacteriaceae bacterium]|nr:phosphoribosylglycinamide formyltransferase [Cyclobacteriaceae bacterium]
MSKKFRIAVFASGSGTNAERIFEHFKNHDSIEVALLLSNNAEAYALKRAANANVPSKIFSRQEFREGTVLQWLKEAEITHIVLAGFLWLVPSELISSYSDRIINIHPALLPKYGGKGMYGSKVHEAVKLAEEKETGITIHLVNEKYDEGRTLFQTSVEISPTDTPDEIASKVHQLEYAHYPEVIEKWILGIQ